MTSVVEEKWSFIYWLCSTHCRQYIINHAMPKNIRCISTLLNFSHSENIFAGTLSTLLKRNLRFSFVRHKKVILVVGRGIVAPNICREIFKSRSSSMDLFVLYLISKSSSTRITVLFLLFILAYTSP